MSGQIVEVDVDEELIMYGVFTRMVTPLLYVAEIGTHVYYSFQEAWDAFLSPMWGDRAVYESRVPRDGGITRIPATGGGGVTILTRAVTSWLLVTPETLVTLNVEKKLGGKPFFNDTQMKDDNSWYAQMTRALAKLRYENLSSPHGDANGRVVDAPGAITFGELRWVLGFIPTDYAMKIQKTLSTLVMQYGSLRHELDVVRKDRDDARKAVDELRKNLILETGLGKNPRGSSPFDGMPAALPPPTGTSGYWKTREREAEKERLKRLSEEVVPQDPFSVGETLKKFIKKEGL